MANNNEIAQAVRTFLDGFDEPYEYDEATGQFELDVELKCRLAGARIFMVTQDDGLTVYTTVNVLADPDSRPGVAEYIVRANHGLLCGGFEMDMDNGAVNYKTFIYCGGNPPAELDITVAMAMSVTALNRFGDGFIDVINNEKTPEEAAILAKGENRRD
jgi:hypothetical protein